VAVGGSGRRQEAQTVCIAGSGVLGRWAVLVVLVLGKNVCGHCTDAPGRGGAAGSPRRRRESVADASRGATTPGSDVQGHVLRGQADLAGREIAERQAAGDHRLAMIIRPRAAKVSGRGAEGSCVDQPAGALPAPHPQVQQGALLPGGSLRDYSRYETINAAALLRDGQTKEVGDRAQRHNAMRLWPRPAWAALWLRTAWSTITLADEPSSSGRLGTGLLPSPPPGQPPVGQW
jgi:hypothetical protein